MSRVSTIMPVEVDATIKVRFTSGASITVENVISYGMSIEDDGLFLIFIEGQDHPRNIVNVSNVDSISVIATAREEVLPDESKGSNKTSE